MVGSSSFVGEWFSAYVGLSRRVMDLGAERAIDDSGYLACISYRTMTLLSGAVTLVDKARSSSSLLE
jgi:hypothetical protein